jgi:hypothetical protein
VIPSLGRVVEYALTKSDAEAINKRRADAWAHLSAHRENSNGVQVHFGNSVSEGDKYPLVITRVWSYFEQPNESHAINGQVLLDGNDNLWVTSVHQDPDGGFGKWREFPRV